MVTSPAKRQILIAAMIGVALTGCQQLGEMVESKLTGTSESDVRRRVETMLEEIRLGGWDRNAHRVEAVARWWGGTPVGPQYAEAATQFIDWLGAGSIHRGLSDYEVTTIEPAEAEGAYVVSGTIDGNGFEMLVPVDESISWRRAPRP